jgi:osmotically-inducible protein OsmY
MTTVVVKDGQILLGGSEKDVAQAARAQRIVRAAAGKRPIVAMLDVHGG